jgi:hypothetical protein
LSLRVWGQPQTACPEPNTESRKPNLGVNSGHLQEGL